MKFPTLRGLGRSSANATDVHSAAVRRALGLGSAASPSAINTADDTGSLSPITLTSPMPSITPPSPSQLSSSQINPSPLCQFNQWVADNAALAGLGLVGLYLLLTSKKGKR